MGKSDQTFSRENAIDVETFHKLFIGALNIEHDQQRIRAVTVVLLAGRLGMRANEIQHLHEGWIDWERGVIRIPAHDPCFCKWCIDAAKGKVATRRANEINEEIEDEDEEVDPDDLDVQRDEPEVLEYCYKHQFTPKQGASARVIPFGWSRRITAWLMLFFEHNDYVGVSQQQLRDDTRKAGTLAVGVDAEDLTPHPLRATGGTFWADAGLLAKPLMDLMGWSDLEQARRYVRASGRKVANEVYKVFGKEEWAPDVVPDDPGETFPIVCNPQPFAAENIDPTNYGPAARQERAKERDEEGRVLFNPRREKRWDHIPYDPERHDLPGHVKPDGERLQEPDAERRPADSDVRDWIPNLNADAEESDVERGQPQHGLTDFGPDEDGTVALKAGVKAAYVTAVVAIAWWLTIAPLV